MSWPMPSWRFVKNKNLLKRALSAFGPEAQLDQCQEECAELIVAINHYRRNRIPVTDLAEEMADVELLIEQLLMVLDIEPAIYRLIQTKKMRKLEERLQGYDTKLPHVKTLRSPGVYGGNRRKVEPLSKALRQTP